MQARRASDALRVVDGVVDSYLRHSNLGGRRIANLAATIAIENSGARWGSLLLNDGEGLHSALAIRDDLTAAHAVLEVEDRAPVERAEDTAELVVHEEFLAAPIILDGEVKGVLYLKDFAEPPGESVQDLASSVASRIAGLLRNADLLAALDRSRGDLHSLALLSEGLSAGHLDERQLDQSVKHAVTGSASQGGVLGLFSPEGGLESCHSVGQAPDATSARLLAEGLSPGNLDALAKVLPGTVLTEKLRAELLDRDSAERVSGFLAVFRATGAAYSDSESSFVRSIGNLLSGALARRDYFRKASEDALTATGSRFALQLELAEAETRSRQTTLPFTLLLADIDRFKEINDDYGHLVGDEVLKDVAEVLRGRLRALDSVSRYGGDEFVVVLPDTGVEAAMTLANQLCGLVREKRFAAMAEPVSVSLGVAEHRVGDSPAETLRRADLALYESKRRGRDQVTQYRSDLG